MHLYILYIRLSAIWSVLICCVGPSPPPHGIRTDPPHQQQHRDSSSHSSLSFGITPGHKKIWFNCFVPNRQTSAAFWGRDVHYLRVCLRMQLLKYKEVFETHNLWRFASIFIIFGLKYFVLFIAYNYVLDQHDEHNTGVCINTLIGAQQWTR